MPWLVRKDSKVGGPEGGKHRYCALEFAFWASLSTLAFHVPMLEGAGFTSLQVGAMMAVNNVVAIVAPVAWGYVADRTGRVVRTFLLATGLVVFMTTALPLVLPIWFLDVPVVSIVMAGYQIGYAGAYSLLDALVVAVCRQNDDWVYPQIRMWGAVGYFMFTMLLTFAAMRLGYGVVYIICAGLGVALSLGASRLPEPDNRDVRADNAPIDFRALLGNPLYLLLLGFTLFFHVTLYATSTFVPYLLRDLGLDMTVAGALSGIRGVAELPVYLLGGFLLAKVRRPQSVLVVAGVLYCLENISYLFCDSVWQIVVAQFVGGMGYGLFLTVSPSLAFELAPRELKASSQTLIASVVFAGNIVASIASGAIIDIAGARTLYLCTSVQQLIATGLYSLALWLLVRRMGKSGAQADRD